MPPVDLFDVKDIPAPDLWPDIERRLDRFEAPDGPPDRAPPGMRRRLPEPIRRLGMVAAVFVLVAASIGLAASVFLNGDRSDRAPGTDTGSGPASASNLRSVGVTPFAGEIPVSVTTGQGAVWVGFLETNGRGAVAKIDPSTGRLVGRAGIQSTPEHLAAGFGALWAVHRYPYTLVRIDIRTMRVTDSMRLTGRPNDVAVAGDSVWVAARDGLWRFADEGTAARVRVPLATSGTPFSLAVGAGAVWVDACHGYTGWGADVVRVEPSTGQAGTAIHVAKGCPRGFAAGAGAVWMLGQNEWNDPSDASTRGWRVWLARVDTSASIVTSRSLFVGSGIPNANAIQVMADEHGVWALLGTSDGLVGVVQGVNPATGDAVGNPAVLGSLGVVSAGDGWMPSDGAVGDGSMWVTTVQLPRELVQIRHCSPFLLLWTHCSPLP